MSEKLKDKTSFVLQLVKSALFGVIISIVLVLVLAFVLKFIEMSDGAISVCDEIIKIISIFLSVVGFIKKSPYKILYKGALVGAIYTVLTFIVFSALRGTYSFGLNFVLDVVFGAITGVIVAIIINIFKREKVAV